MKPVISLLFLALGIKSYAQRFPSEGLDSIKLARTILAKDYRSDTLKTFFSFNWQNADPENAFYFTEIFSVSDHWCALDYYIQNKSLASKGFFKDRELNIKDGPFIDFYENGGKARYGHYKEGKRTGWWVQYSDSGKVKDSTFYILDMPAGRSVSWHPTGEIASISEMDTFGTGIGSDTGYFKSGMPAYYGQYSKGFQKNGWWRHFYPDGKPAYEAIFDKGKLISQTCFDPSGNVQKDCSREKMPEFPGGPKKLMKYLANHISYPDYKTNGYILAQFTVDTSGKIQNIKIIKPLPEIYGDTIVKAYNNAVIHAIQKMPDWEPAIQYNRKVKVYYTLPVRFRFK